MTSHGNPRIVVGYDGSSYAKHAIAWAADYVTSHDGQLEVVCAWHWPPMFGMPVSLGDYVPSDDAEKIAQEGIALSGLPADRVTSHVMQGPAGQCLVVRAKGADLLVVGSRGHNNFTDLVLGSSSNYCVHHAPCNVTVVRPPS